jgi:hypothetical protein
MTMSNNKNEKLKPLGNGLGVSQAFIDKYLPTFEQGKVYFFEVWPGPRPNPAQPGTFYVTAQKIINDTYVIRDTETGKNVNMKRIKGYTAGPNNEQIEVLHHVYFSRHHMKGKIMCNGSDPGDYEKFVWLYFHSQNRFNAEWPYHIKPEGGYQFRLLSDEKKAENRIDHVRMRNEAQDYLLGLKGSEGEQTLRVISEELKKQRQPGFTYTTLDATSQVLDKLLKVAENHPMVILKFDRELDMEIRVLVKEAFDHGIVTFNRALKKVEWGTTGQDLVYLRSHATPEDALVRHLLSDSELGQNDRIRIIQQLQGEVEEDEEIEEVTVVTDEMLAEARSKYEKLYERKVFHGWDYDTLMQKIEEKEAELASA